MLHDNDDLILDERTLPLYLQQDIQAYKACIEANDKLHLDLYWGELYGSINSAQYGYEISKEIADYLRKKYLGI
ncbi:MULTISPECIES: hypothetical protein [unclassified Campylobacter]|uniref:hypothetical protein n=1 Tax=unclassified Campylobacter TaxID=2593542 RepID=UPI0022E9A4E0|nr:MULTISPECIES: hypothetical protein [unclassified Campylobacter]MDA3048219.1 hypothetical protein [Campylobacter sp. JMF_08 NE1]MDA3055008.1 hypothetical protein [Campylobacter sp. VBCF_07 NA4]MDA3060510.1 hypothetical protein [Campylobacter sp. VBCF_02 NA5]MDA3070224.1 hypothetical protein [Campylobacter sp. VBCF_08 NA3]WBR54657.1 hypothetical protein PF027_01945 [Campylobacter sp. VBCF_01 NA2]